MSNYEDILVLIKHCFECFMERTISVPDDLSDGKLYIELLKQCCTIEDSGGKSINFEIIENFMKDHYRIETNEIVYYEGLAFEECPCVEDTIKLCMLVFGICRHYGKKADKLSASDSQRLSILLRPVDLNGNDRILSKVSFEEAIRLASEKDLDDNSLMMDSFNSKYSADNNLDNSRCQCDDHSLNNVSISSNTKSSVDFLLGQDYLKRKSRRLLGTSRKNRHHCKWKSIVQRNNEISDVNYLKELYLDLEQENKQLLLNNKALEKRNFELQKENTALHQSKLDSIDEVDIYRANNDKLSKEKEKKQKEYEKTKGDLNELKELHIVDVNEIKRLKELNEQLKNDLSYLSERMKSIEKDHTKQRQTESDTIQNLRDEILEYQSKLMELEKQMKRDQQIINTNNNDLRDSSVLSSVTNTEGENMGLFFETDYHCFHKQLDREKERIESLQSDLNRETLNKEKLSDEVAKLRIQIDEQQDEIKTLKNEQNKPVPTIESRDDMDIKEIFNRLSEIMNNQQLSANDRNRLSEIVGMPQTNNLKCGQIHLLCQQEILSLQKVVNDDKNRLTHLKKQTNELELRNDELEQENCDLLHQIQDLTINLERARNQKSKYEESEFKMKKTILSTEDERKQIKRQLDSTEKELKEKSKQYNLLLEKFDSRCRDISEMAYDLNYYREQIYKMVEAKEEAERIRLNNKSANKMPNSARGNRQQQSMSNLINSNNNALEMEKINLDFLSNPDCCSTETDQNTYSCRKQSEVVREANRKKSSHQLKSYDDNTDHVPPRLKKDSAAVDGTQISKVTQDLSNMKSLNKVVESKSNMALKSRQAGKSVSPYPLMKKERVYQLQCRNQQQPSHLKSCYPVETQTLTDSVVGATVCERYKIPLEYSDQLDRPTQSARLHTDRHHGLVDPMNFASSTSTNTNSTARGSGCRQFQYSGNAFSEEFIKCADDVQQQIIITPKVDSDFLKPTVPIYRNPHRRQVFDNDNLNRENIIPTPSMSDSSICSSKGNSIRFEIPNSPTKYKSYAGFPRVSIKRR